MTTGQETNVRVLPCVLEALGRIVIQRGVSRDEAVRQVLAEHVAEQEKRRPEDRLTHISTVLRHPPPAGRGQERVDRTLRLRLPDGLAARARAVSLHLPGQYLRAHKDYVARPLTDAVVTAIAVHEPFTDSVLEGLLPLLRHNAALGLWQLAVAVTSTRPELAIQDKAEHLRIRPSGTLTRYEKRLLLIAEQLDDQVAWHASFRFTVAANLARAHLAGDDAVAAEDMLYEQGEEWNEVRLDLRHDRHKHRWFAGTAGWDASGRGSTAVWRASRKADLGDFTEWLLSRDGHTPSSRVVPSPGWSVRVPAGWATYVVPHGHELPQQFTQWADAGQVMVLALDGRQVVWPVRPGHHLPVPGAEPLVTAARNLRPHELAEFVEAVLIEWGTNPYDTEDGVWLDDHDDVDPDDAMVEAELQTPWLWLPVDQAVEFEFIDAAQRRTAKAVAREYVRDLSHYKANDERVVATPAPTLDADFTLFVTRRRTGRTAKAMWRWPRGSVADEVFAGTSPAVIGWLAGRALWMARWMVHAAMEQAWHDGFDHYPLTFWRPGGIPDDEDDDAFM